MYPNEGTQVSFVEARDTTLSDMATGTAAWSIATK